jgi:hypothetical protein
VKLACVVPRLAGLVHKIFQVVTLKQKLNLSGKNSVTCSSSISVLTFEVVLATFFVCMVTGFIVKSHI